MAQFVINLVVHVVTTYGIVIVAFIACLILASNKKATGVVVGLVCLAAMYLGLAIYFHMPVENPVGIWNSLVYLVSSIRL